MSFRGAFRSKVLAQREYDQRLASAILAAEDTTPRVRTAKSAQAYGGTRRPEKPRVMTRPSQRSGDSPPGRKSDSSTEITPRPPPSQEPKKAAAAPHPPPRSMSEGTTMMDKAKARARENALKLKLETQQAMLDKLWATEQKEKLARDQAQRASRQMAQLRLQLLKMEEERDKAVDLLQLAKDEAYTLRVENERLRALLADGEGGDREGGHAQQPAARPSATRSPWVVSASSAPPAERGNHTDGPDSSARHDRPSHATAPAAHAPPRHDDAQDAKAAAIQARVRGRNARRKLPTSKATPAAASPASAKATFAVKLNYQGGGQDGPSVAASLGGGGGSSSGGGGSGGTKAPVASLNLSYAPANGTYKAKVNFDKPLTTESPLPPSPPSTAADFLLHAAMGEAPAAPVPSPPPQHAATEPKAPSSSAADFISKPSNKEKAKAVEVPASASAFLAMNTPSDEPAPETSTAAAVEPAAAAPSKAAAFLEQVPEPERAVPSGAKQEKEPRASGSALVTEPAAEAPSMAAAFLQLGSEQDKERPGDDKAEDGNLDSASAVSGDTAKSAINPFAKKMGAPPPRVGGSAFGKKKFF